VYSPEAGGEGEAVLSEGPLALKAPAMIDLNAAGQSTTL
jgi:hypothetical protein